MLNIPKPIWKYSILRFSSNGKFVDGGRNLVNPFGVTWSCGKNWSSLTAICVWWFCGLGAELANGDVSGNCRFFSFNSKMRIKVRLIHMNLLLDQYFRFDPWAYFACLCLLTSLDHTDLHPQKGSRPKWGSTKYVS